MAFPRSDATGSKNSFVERWRRAAGLGGITATLAREKVRIVSDGGYAFSCRNCFGRSWPSRDGCDVRGYLRHGCVILGKEGSAGTPALPFWQYLPEVGRTVPASRYDAAVLFAADNSGTIWTFESNSVTVKEGQGKGAKPVKGKVLWRFKEDGS